MNDIPAAPSTGTATDAPAAPAAAASSIHWQAWLMGAAVAAAAGGLAFSLSTQSRLRSLEQELVKRQQDSHGLVTEAALLSRQAQESAREAAAKIA
ncbi:MAG: hypothetical protein ACKVQR_20235, partial [Aquabacterium sp.]